MKVKKEIPEGVIVLVDILPQLNENDDVKKLQKILKEIIGFSKSSMDKDAEKYFKGKDAEKYFIYETKEFKVEDEYKPNNVFGEWATPNSKDPFRKIVREVCLIIKNNMFEQK